jgi:hypothetical protein
VINFTKGVLKIAQENLRLAQTGNVDEIAKIQTMPQVPISFADSYTRVIRMLELSVDKPNMYRIIPANESLYKMYDDPQYAATHDPDVNDELLDDDE